MKLYLKGERCYKESCCLEAKSDSGKKGGHAKAYAPGQHGSTPRKISDYGVQLREKQKVKRIYGVLEAQFRRCFEKANRAHGITGEILLQLLERRLDNVVYRAGFASSRRQARQIVRHNHIAVNGKKVNIPSYVVRPGENIMVKEPSRKIEGIVQSLETSDGRGVPEWLAINKQGFSAEMLRLPEREDINYEIQESLIVELYSK
jgi:small subunit ribosomal protein S4